MKTPCGLKDQLVAIGLAFWLAGFGPVLGLLPALGCSSVKARDRESTGASYSSNPTAGGVELLDLRNRPVNPFRVADAKALVFVFVRTDCPISNRYAPEIERLYGKHAPQGSSFWLVYPDPETRPPEIVQHTKEFHLSLPAVRDPQHALVKKAGVRATPEVAVFFPDGRQAYRGRIDNRYADFGKERAAPTQRDLDDVLNSILNGRPVTNAHTVAVGCYIPELR